MDPTDGQPTLSRAPADRGYRDRGGRGGAFNDMVRSYRQRDKEGAENDGKAGSSAAPTESKSRGPAGSNKAGDGRVVDNRPAWMAKDNMAQNGSADTGAGEGTEKNVSFSVEAGTEEVEDEAEMADLEAMMMEDDEDEEAKAARLAEERKQRRAAILAKHQATKPSEPAVAVAATAPTAATPAAPVETTSSTPAGPASSSASASASAAAAAPEPQAPSSATAGDEAQAQPSTEEAETEAGAAAAASGASASVFDIFSSNPENALAQLGASRQNSTAALMEGIGGVDQDNHDDLEGYYITRIGEVIGGRYQVRGAMGKGVFSTVLSCIDLQQGSIQVAIKMVRNNDIMRKAAQKELELLGEIADKDPENRRHCVRLLGQIEHRAHTCMIFESLQMNLRETLKKFGKNVGINVKSVRTYSKQLFVALKHIASLGIVHADIKPDNILVSEVRP